VPRAQREILSSPIMQIEFNFMSVLLRPRGRVEACPVPFFIRWEYRQEKASGSLHLSLRQPFEQFSVCPRRRTWRIASFVITGGAAGTGVGSPGTNSSGMALSSGGGGNGVHNASLSGTNPVVDREGPKVDRMIKSICRGC
jgi:hypothetical protein